MVVSFLQLCFCCFGSVECVYVVEWGMNVSSPFVVFSFFNRWWEFNGDDWLVFIGADEPKDC